MGRNGEYGKLPPKKLKRLKELIESGLKNPGSDHPAGFE